MHRSKFTICWATEQAEVMRPFSLKRYQRADRQRRRNGTGAFHVGDWSVLCGRLMGIRPKPSVWSQTEDTANSCGRCRLHFLPNKTSFLFSALLNYVCEGFKEQPVGLIWPCINPHTSLRSYVWFFGSFMIFFPGILLLRVWRNLAISNT